MGIILNFVKYETVQKKEILEFFFSNRERVFSTEEIESALPGVAKSTLYRVLAALVEENRIKLCQTSARKRVYQYNDELCPFHMHIRCTSCGKIEHLSEEESRRISDIVSCSGYSLSFASTLEGLCKECRGE